MVVQSVGTMVDVLAGQWASVSSVSSALQWVEMMVDALADLLVV